MKILLAIDGSECSNAVVTEVLQRPWPADAEFKVLTVYEVPMVTPQAWTISPDYCERVEEVVRDVAQTASVSAWSRLNQKFGSQFPITSEVISGSPQSGILEVAESWNADLIILGSHGYRAWERLFLGSVSQAVVTHARCSVEVVRSHVTDTTSTSPPTHYVLPVARTK